MSRPSLVRGYGKHPTTYTWPPNTDKPEHVLPSLTNVLKLLSCMDGPRKWAIADGTNNNWDEWAKLPADLRRKQIALATEHPSHPWVQKRNLGSNVHAMIAGEDPEYKTDLDPAPYMQAARHFWTENIAERLYAEHTIYNPTAGYAGTADIIYTGKDGRTTLADWKTGTVMNRSNRPYGYSELQAVGYSNGEFIGTPDGQVIEMPAIHRALIVQLNDDATWKAYEVELGITGAYDALVALCAVKRYAAFVQQSVISSTPLEGSA